MLLFLQLLKDPLDAFSGNDLREIQKAHPAADILSLDNFSDQWLINSAFEEVKKEPEAKIIIIRHENAELKNLQSLLIQLPQLSQVKILFSGTKITMLERISGFKNINFKSISASENLPEQVKKYFSK